MPGIDFTHAPPWLQWIIGAVAVLGFIGAAFGLIKGIPAGWRVLYRFVTTINALAELPTELSELREFRADTTTKLDDHTTILGEHTETLDEQNTKINEIHHELQYNNESSVKDATLRIELGVKAVSDQVVELKEADAALRADLEHTQPKENPNE